MRIRKKLGVFIGAALAQILGPYFGVTPEQLMNVVYLAIGYKVSQGAVDAVSAHAAGKVESEEKKAMVQIAGTIDAAGPPSEQTTRVPTDIIPPTIARPWES